MHASAAIPLTLGVDDLRRLETALLDAILDVRADRTNALDRLLSDPGFSNGEQVEQFLVAAVLDTHPDRNRALDRMLDEITKTAPVV